jgi:hypothetical protein
VVSVVALLVSVVALVVACASAYLTIFAPAEIELDHIRQPGELQPGPFDPQPEQHRVSLAFFVSNTGARGGLLERVGVPSLAVKEGSLWIGVERLIGPLSQKEPAGAPALEAIALEAGDVRTIFLHIDLRPAPLGPEDQAVEFRALASVSLAVEWTFRRSIGLGRWRRRSQVSRQLVVDVDARPYREAAVQRWRSLAQYAHLADIAEGRAEPTTS